MADTKFCTHCGQKTENNVNFCPNCGNRLPSKPAREEPQSNIKALNYTPGFSNRINGPEVMAATEKNEKKEKNSWPFCCRCRLWDSSFTRF